jgi:Gluconate 2-dehydrogenase subunit 3
MTPFRTPDHLPNLRGGEAADPHHWLPRHRNGTTPQMHGRYPDYNVLDERDHWDPLTRKVVLDRLGEPPPIRFFTPAEAATLSAFCDVVLAQDAEPRIPVVNMLDAKLHEGRLDGYRYAELPDDPETWRLVARGLDEEAARRFGAADYTDLPADDRRDVCRRFAAGALDEGVWATLPAKTAWKVVTRMILAEFYSHPWAWNEIGYAGPAYPRGFARLGVGQSEAWEAVPVRDSDVDPVRSPPSRPEP